MSDQLPLAVVVSNFGLPTRPFVWEIIGASGTIARSGTNYREHCLAQAAGEHALAALEIEVQDYERLERYTALTAISAEGHCPTS